MKTVNTKALVEGAVFASLTAVLGIMVYYIPLLSLIGMFWAVPIIIMGFRNGFKVSFISAIVAGILVSMFTEPYSGLYLFLVFGISGIYMGNLMNKKVRPSINILTSGLILAFCSAAGIIMSFWLVGQSPLQGAEQLMKMMYEAMEGASNMYQNMGIPAEQIEEFTVKFKQSIEAIKYIIPAFFIINGMVFSFANFKLSKIILGRMKYNLEDIKPFSEWKLPDNFSIGLFLLLFLTMVAFYFKIPNIETATVNIIFLLKWVFTILGLSVASFMLAKYGITKYVKGIILFILFFALQNVLMIAGIFDAIFDIRKIGKRYSGGI